MTTWSPGRSTPWMAAFSAADDELNALVEITAQLPADTVLLTPTFFSSREGFLETTVVAHRYRLEAGDRRLEDPRPELIQAFLD